MLSSNPLSIISVVFEFIGLLTTIFILAVLNSLETKATKNHQECSELLKAHSKSIESYSNSMNTQAKAIADLHDELITPPLLDSTSNGNVLSKYGNDEKDHEEIDEAERKKVQLYSDIKVALETKVKMAADVISELNGKVNLLEKKNQDLNQSLVDQWVYFELLFV